MFVCFFPFFFFHLETELFSYFSDFLFFCSSSAFPEAPTSIDLLEDETSSESLHIRWIPGDNGGIEQWYQVSHRVNKDGMNFGPEVKVEGATEMIIGNLNSSTEYEIKVIAENVVGRSQEGVSLMGYTLRKYFLFKAANSLSDKVGSSHIQFVLNQLGLITLSPDPFCPFSTGPCFIGPVDFCPLVSSSCFISDSCYFVLDPFGPHPFRP